MYWYQLRHVQAEKQRIIHRRAQIWIFSSSVKIDSSQVSAAKELDEELNTGGETNLYATMYNFVYRINCRVIQGFLALRKAVTTHVKKISYFFTCVDIANQLLTRHSPLAPLGQVDESLHDSEYKLFLFCSNYGG